MRRLARIRRDWPTLAPLLVLVVGAALVIGLSLLWAPAVWIVVVGMWAFLFAAAARADIKRRRQ